MPTHLKKLRAMFVAVSIGATLAALSPTSPRDGSTSDHAAPPMSMIEGELVEATLRAYGY
jgi:hypothetical protein